MNEALAPHRLVNASAGTGKTYRLAVEYLRLLDRAGDGGGAGSILATTFTRKAAGEILERILLRLAEATLDERAASVLGGELARAGWDRSRAGTLLLALGRDLNRLQVGTLDAFLLRLVSICRLELGLPPRPLLAAPDDPRAVRLRAEALERVLDQQASSDFSALFELVERLHDDQARASVAAALDLVLQALYDQYREAPAAAVWCALSEPPGLLGEAALDELLGEHNDLAIRLPNAFQAALRDDRRRVEHRAWEELMDRGLGAAVLADERAPRYRNVELPRSAILVYQRLLAHARAVVIGRLQRRAAATHQLLELFHREFDRLRRERGLLLFSDLPHLVRERLRDRTAERLLEIQYRLDGSVGHLLLDEFQDTSLEQWRVIEPFADEILAWGDGTRSFFCVGDAKQAIYGWRGGRTELFEVVAERVARRGGALEAQLVCHRAGTELIATADRVCRSLLDFGPLRDDRAVLERWLRYLTPLAAADPTRPGYVEVRQLPPVLAGGTGAPDAASEEAGVEEEPAELFLDAVAEWIAEVAAAMPGTIGVLARTNRRVGLVSAALRRRGLAASGEGGSPLIDDPLVVLLLEVLQLADHPRDSVAAFHLHASPLRAVLGLDRLSAQQVAEGLRRDLLARGPAVVLAGLAAALAPYADARSALRLRQLLELTERTEPSLGLRPSELLDLAALAEVEEPSPARIRVMTIHKAKGLEFDAVVLCELDAPIGESRDIVTLADRPDPAAPPAAIYPHAPAAVRQLVPELARAHGQERARRLWDDASALYVGLTRARFAVLLPLPGRAFGARRATMGELARQALAPEAPETARGRVYAAGEPNWGRAVLPPVAVSESEAAAAWPPRPPARAVFARNLPIVEPSLQGRGRDLVEPRELLRLTAEQERLRGTLLHAWLAEIDVLPPGGRLDRLALRQVGRVLAPRLAAATLERWLDELQLAVEQPAVRARLLPPETRRGEALEIWREKPFARVVRGELWSGRFDRVVLVRRGGGFVGAELVDWKGDQVSASQVPAVAAGYRPQLDAYREALAAMLGLLPTAVRAHLVFLTPGLAVAS